MSLSTFCDDGIERRVGADAQPCAGQVVVDGGRDADDRNAQGAIFGPVGKQVVGKLIARPAADDQQAVDAKFGQPLGDSRIFVAFRQLAAGAQLRPTLGNPAMDAHPAHLVDVAIEQPGHAVTDAQDHVPLIDCQAHCCAHRRVHPGRRGSGVQDAQPQLVLAGLRRVRLGLEDRMQDRVGFDETAPAQFHGLCILAGFDKFRHPIFLMHILHERRTGHLVVADADQLRLAVGCGS